MIHDQLDTVAGTFRFVENSDGALVAGVFGTPADLASVCSDVGEPGRARHREVLEEYFAGDLDALQRIDVAQAGTPFFQTVWKALRDIPPGARLTYGALAAELRSGPRAVASACARNQVALVIPCHRVVGAGGRLTGYRWGIDVKRRLLEFEATPH